MSTTRQGGHRIKVAVALSGRRVKVSKTRQSGCRITMAVALSGRRDKVSTTRQGGHRIKVAAALSGRPVKVTTTRQDGRCLRRSSITRLLSAAQGQRSRSQSHLLLPHALTTKRMFLREETSKEKLSRL